MNNNFKFLKTKTKEGKTYFIKKLKFLNNCSTIILDKNHDDYLNLGIAIRRFDISNFNCDFYELCLDADIPDGTQINISYYLSDYTEIIFESVDWKRSHIGYYASNIGDAHPKKYLWTKIELTSSNPKKTPELKSINLFPIQRFDVSDLNCNFYELSLDADTPDGSQINVSYITTNTEIPSKPLEWKKPEPHNNFYTSSMGCILPRENNESYLWVRLELISSSILKTFKIRSLKLRQNKVSYLNYLPEIYQKDTDSKEFLERFLSIFEAFFYDSEEKINNVSNYFDPDKAPSDFLPWLGTWTSTVFDESPSDFLPRLGTWTSTLFDETWSDDKKREFLNRAVEFYKIKGTKKGIEELIKLYIDIEIKEIIFIENWEKFYELNEKNELKPKYEFSEDGNEWFNKLFKTDELFHFYVILIPKDFNPIIKNMLSEVILDNLINHQKPAHTTSTGIILKPGVFLDNHSYIGINSYLTEFVPKLEKNSIIGEMFSF